MFRLIALLPLLSPAWAEAACPSRSDRADGIILVQNWPHFRRADFENTPRGLRETRLDKAGGGAANSVSWYAHGLALSLEQTRRGERSVSYHGDVRAFDRLAQQREVAVAATVAERGGARREVTVRATHTGSDAYALGECSYDAWQVRYELRAAGAEPEVFLFDYLHELGVVAAASTMTADGKEILGYRYTWIGTKADVRR